MRFGKLAFWAAAIVCVNLFSAAWAEPDSKAPAPAGTPVRTVAALPHNSELFKFEKIAIPGGPTLICQNIPELTAVAVCLCVPAGSLYDKPGKMGTAHLTEHLMFRTVKGYPVGRLQLEFEKIGARRGASVTARTAQFWETVPSGEINKALEAECGRLAGFAATNKELAQEQAILKAELARLNADPLRSVQRYLGFQLNIPGGISALDPSGNIVDIDNIALDDLKAFYAEHYRKDEATITVIGNFDPNAAENTIKQYFVKNALVSADKGPDANAADNAGTADLSKVANDKENGGAANLSLGAEAAQKVPAQSTAQGASAQEVAQEASANSEHQAQENAMSKPSVPGCLLKALNVSELTGEKRAAVYVADALLSQGECSYLYKALQKSDFNDDIEIASDDNADGFYAAGLYFADNISPQAAAELFDKALGECRYVSADDLLTAKDRALLKFYRCWEKISNRCRMVSQAETQGKLDDLLALPDNIANLHAKSLESFIAGFSAKSATYVSDNGRNTSYSNTLPVTEAYAEPYVRYELDNGMKLLCWEDTASEVVYLSGYINGGSRLDPPGLQGITSIVSDMLNSGEGVEELRGKAASLGIKLEFVCDKQLIVIKGSCLKGDLPRLLEYLSGILQKDITEQSAENARLAALAKAERGNSDLLSSIYSEFLRMLFPAGYPFAHDVSGTAESIAIITADDIRAHFKEICRPDRVVIALTGGVESNIAYDEFKSNFDSWQKPQLEIPALPAVAPITARSASISCAGGEMVAAGSLGPDRDNPQYHSFCVLMQILGGSTGGSRLPIRIVHLEKIGTSVNASVIPYSGRAPWIIAAKVNPGQSDRAIAIIKQELQRLRDYGPTEEEMKRAVSCLSGRFLVNACDLEARADLMCSMEYHHSPGEWISGKSSAYDKVTISSLRATAQKWLYPDKLVIVRNVSQQ